MRLYKRADSREELIRRLDGLKNKAYGAYKYILSLTRHSDEANARPDIDWWMRQRQTKDVEYSAEYLSHLEAWCTLVYRFHNKYAPKILALKPKTDEWYGILYKILMEYSDALKELRGLEDSGG